jgi:hypothetical protein
VWLPAPAAEEPKRIFEQLFLVWVEHRLHHDLAPIVRVTRARCT